MQKRVKINVSGTTFEFDSKLLEKKSAHRLAALCREQTYVHDNIDHQGAPPEVTQRVTCDRSARGFEAVLQYFQTGQLHIPACMCPGAFRDEMTYWNIQPEALQECCLFRYQSFLEDQEIRRHFLQCAHPATTYRKPRTLYLGHRLRHFRQRVWEVVNNDERSTAARVYFGVIFCMVTLSILTLSFSTVTSWRRNLSPCELLEYMEYTNNAKLEAAREFFGQPDCPRYSLFMPVVPADEEIDVANKSFWSKAMIKLVSMNIIKKLKESIKSSNSSDSSFSNGSWSSGNETEWNATSSQSSSVSSWSLWDSIFRSVKANATEQTTTARTIDLTTSSTETAAPTTTENRHANANETFIMSEDSVSGLKSLTLPVAAIYITDSVLLLLFTVDVFLRLLTCPNYARHFLTVVTILDLGALAASYLSVTVISIFRQYRYLGTTWLTLLTYVQILRVFRLFRIVKNVRAAKVLLYVMLNSLQDAMLLVLLLAVFTSMFACLFYFAESDKAAPSIPLCWYWAVMTMTTVGYGDVIPETEVGRLVASMCALTGVILLSITVPLFVNKFVTFYRYSCVNRNSYKQSKSHSTIRRRDQ